MIEVARDELNARDGVRQDRPQSMAFETLARELLSDGKEIRFQARGASMSPAIRDGEIVLVKAAVPAELRRGDIVLAKGDMGFRLHRLVVADAERDVFITRGDCGRQDDPAVSSREIFGIARAKEVRVGQRNIPVKFSGVGGAVLRGTARAQYLLEKALAMTGPRSRPAAVRSRNSRPAKIRLAVLGVFCVLLLAARAYSQVAVDASTNGSAELTGGGGNTATLSFNHTTTATANRVLVVGVSINITNAATTTVATISYNTATAMTFIGAHNDAGGTRRVEMWYLLNPASGTNLPITVTVNIPFGTTEGVVAGATTFTGVDQTVPLGTFVSGDGAAATNSQLDVPSVINGMLLDTLAIGGNRTATVNGPQVQQWNANTGGSGNRDITAIGSSRTGAPSVPISENFAGGSSNWSLGAISINPSTADIGVTTKVSAVALGQNSTYNITVTNSGLSGANAVTLTDTYASTGLSVVSVTPSTGTTCTTGTTISCTLPTPFASGATATIAVVVSTTTAGFYPNTATVTDSGTPPDPNTGNNTYVSLAPVVSVVCTTNTLTAGGTITGVLNTYYPGSANVAAGATSIPVGTPVGAGAIAAGSLLLVIQMQDASISTSNSVTYGNGSTGSGFTTINNAGNYEFVKATGAVSGGLVPITGAGTGSGLVFAYTAAAASATKGLSTYQVVLVPQYTTATIGAVTATPWNGQVGGIVALDVAGQLNLGGGTVSVNAQGFRGGAGMQLSGGVAGASNQDYLQTSPATYTGATGGATGIDGSKGEGVAGTPKWVQNPATSSFLQTTTNYPNGTAGVDGSMARGGPGNAGGGGTDGDATGNTENAGGGGGGNGGMGGFGGDSWNTNFSDGGFGGTPFPATIDRVAMGGGGGAGSRNNSDGDNQASGGSAGGGIIFIRADSLTGTATLSANGASSYNGTSNDAGGGGGAGGTIIVLSANGGESGLTLQATGGRGGDAWDSQAYDIGDRHGPGGGGAGGVVFVSGAAAGITLTGGSNGTTLTPGVAYGSTAGGSGTSSTTATLTQVTGIQSAALCTPDMTLGKTHVGNFTRGSSASYTIPVSNVSPYGATSGVVTINDTLPTGITPTSATGTGWTCSVSGQTVSCVRSDSLAAASAYPSITLNAIVSQASPATLVNTDIVAGGGEANLLNDTAMDTASVVSTADIAVTDFGSPDPVTAGSNITYTLMVTNNGPSAADNTTLVVPIPANTTFVSFAAPAGWTCTNPNTGTGNVVCNSLNMPGSTSATFTFAVKVTAGTANGTVITGRASAASSALDPNSLNNTATTTTIVGTTGPNLSVTNVPSPDPVQAGNNITYTQVVTNTGTTAATAGTFTEATPANTTFVSITPPAGWTCPGGVPPCTDPSVGAGASGTFTVVYKVNTGVASGTTITDTATVNAGNQSFGANSAIATDIVGTAAQADLALTTATSPSSVLSGNDITYTQTVSNNGPAAATGVSFSEATPANTTYQSVSAPAGWTCTTPAVGTAGTITCSDPSSFASGDVADIVIVVGVASSVAAGSTTATSTVTATTSDPTTANNTTTATTPITVACDLGVTDSGTPSPVTAGNNITYTQVVTNGGPSNCSTATFTEATPNNSTFVSITPPAGWSCAGFPTQCTDPSVAAGSSGTFTVTYKVAAGTAAGTAIADSVTVATTSRDTNAANNTATSSIGVASGTQADLSVTNSGSPNPVNAGGTITYTQTVFNAGPASAAAPVFTETLPAGTVASSLTGPAGWNCVLGTLTCTDTAAMTANTTANFTYTVTVNAATAAGTTLSQTDSVASTTGDPNSGNNSVTVTTQVADSASLSITNLANPVPVAAGNNITYTQVITNTGPSAATTASMTETTPANTTFQSVTPPAGWSCTTPAVNATGTITCTDPSFAPGTASFSVVLKVTAGTAAGTAINDTVTTTSAVTDPNLGNNSATAADVVALGTQSDLVTTNVASVSTIAAGSNVTYTQSVTNNGPAATAASMTFSEVTPPNTNFQSITPPAGWTCGTVPPVGGTGTITCTDSGSLAVNATANFSVILQVNSGTPSGTSITDTDTATTTNIVPGITTNTASATVVVANANSADMAIVKTGAPNPVTEGTPLTYTLVVTNNGPAQATNVTVIDALPAGITYLSSSSTLGTCSEAGATVTCLLGTMANAGTATVSILTLPGVAGTISNTATVSADQTDPILTNNTSTQSENVLYPTGVTLKSFSARLGVDKHGASRVLLTWKTAGESHNLGFNVYREVNGNRARMNPSVIAGSALLMSGALPIHSGRTYAWIDPSAGMAGASYWLEDIDVNGIRTMHGPVYVSSAAEVELPEAGGSAALETRMMSQMNRAQLATPGSQQSHAIEIVPPDSEPTRFQFEKQFALASHPAVKISVHHEGWYRVTQPELVNAGLDPNVDPARLQLFAEAHEQPIGITGATAGPGGFGPQAAISFYGTGIDTEFSGMRVYWLVAGEGAGARIPQLPVSSGSNKPPSSFPSAVELQQHTIYFAALVSSKGQNFFGALVSPTPVDQVLDVPHFDSASTNAASLDVVLQGVITAFPHDVSIVLNGTTLGDLLFTGQDQGTFSIAIPPGLLQSGSNTVTLTAQDGDYDTSLVDYIRISYPHLYLADADQFKFAGRAGDEVMVHDFTSPPAVLDITNPNRPVQLTPQVISIGGKYEIAVQVPFSSTNPLNPVRHTLLAVADDQISSAEAIRANHPSRWHSAQPGADIAMVTYAPFAASLAPLVQAHQAEGKTSAVVLLSDLYDEFNFGERSPFAIRRFLQTAQRNWKTPPTYLLLNGRASLDPRNYLGLGDLDLVPTRIVPSSSLMTASDDWFSDFGNTGLPTIATGRLPVASVTDATTVIGKIATYEGQSTNGSWTANALMVADFDGTDNFSQDSQTVQAKLPSTMQVTDVFASTVGISAAKTDILNAINSGQVLVNYLGHGSEEEWSGSDIFDTTSVSSLTNGSQLPVFLIMDCLNGFFQDVYEQPLGVTLLLASNGGAVAVLASSGLNQAPPQTILDSNVVQGAFHAKGERLGDAVATAKSHITNLDVRRTFNLFGDPAMPVKQSVPASPAR